MKRLRVLVIVIIAVAAILQMPLPSIAQNVPSYVIHPQTTGSPGTFTVPSTGTTCEVTAQTAFQITVKGPTPKLASGMASGRVDWTPTVYQNLADSRGYQPVRQGPTQSLTISANNATAFQAASFESVPGGGYYSGGGVLTWYNSDSTVRGTYSFLFERYVQISGSKQNTLSNSCNAVVTPLIVVSTVRATVDTVISVQGSNFPISQPVKITWKGSIVGTVTSDAQGNVSGSYKLAATPMGSYQLGLDGGPLWKTSASVTVVPRVKVLPNSAGRGQTVKISLRGFSKGETVRVRWIKGGGWIELGRVKMSSTGSGELWVPVPSWVPDGSSSVRGDGTAGRAQTNAVFISGGASFSTASEQTPTPSPTATPTATATATIPASPVISPTASPTSTEVPATPTPSPSETATETVTATASVTETVEPTIELTPPETETAAPTIEPSTLDASSSSTTP